MTDHATTGYPALMTGSQIQALRRLLQETTETFGARFDVAARTVENWEQDHRRPGSFVRRALAALDRRVKKRSSLTPPV